MSWLQCQLGFVFILDYIIEIKCSVKQKTEMRLDDTHNSKQLFVVVW